MTRHAPWVIGFWLASCLSPAPLPAQPVQLPQPCTQEHLAVAGDPAPCTGVLLPPPDALDGAACIDADLPGCRARARQASDELSLRIARLSAELTETRAQRDRCRARELAPPSLQKSAPPVARGWSTWAVAAAVVAAALAGGYAGLKVGATAK